MRERHEACLWSHPKKGQVSWARGPCRRGSSLAGKRLLTSRVKRRRKKTLATQNMFSQRQSSAEVAAQSHSLDFFFRQRRFQSVTQEKVRDNVQKSIKDIMVELFLIRVRQRLCRELAQCVCKTGDRKLREKHLITEPTVIRHVGVELTKGCLLRVLSVHMFIPCVMFEWPPFLHVASSQKIRKVKCQDFQDLLHRGRRISGKGRSETESFINAVMCVPGARVFACIFFCTTSLANDIMLRCAFPAACRGSGRA